MDKIVFTCAIGTVIGSGHLMRCLTLADEMQRTWPNADIIFWVGEEGINFPALKSSKYKIVTGDDFHEPCDLIVIDNYSLYVDFEKKCRDWARKILVIDDLADRKHDCDILVDQTYGRSAADYRSLVPDHARVLCGAQYALLRPEFAKLRKTSINRRKNLSEIKTILISLGSMNLHNVTSTILDMFLDLKGTYEVKIVLSSQAQYLDAVREKIALIHQKTNHKCELLCDVQHMAQLMTDSDFAIGAGGTTSWERACLALPSALIEIADNQTVIIQNLLTAQAVMTFGHIDDFDQKAVKESFLSVANDPNLMHSLSENSSKICDGMGCQTVITYARGH